MHADFLILVYWNTDTWKYEVLHYKTSMLQYMYNFESPCIEIRRFKNLRGETTAIFESPIIETRRLKNLHVSEHGD